MCRRHCQRYRQESVGYWLAVPHSLAMVWIVFPKAHTPAVRTPIMEVVIVDIDMVCIPIKGAE